MNGGWRLMSWVGLLVELPEQGQEESAEMCAQDDCHRRRKRSKLCFERCSPTRSTCLDSPASGAGLNRVSCSSERRRKESLDRFQRVSRFFFRSLQADAEGHLSRTEDADLPIERGGIREAAKLNNKTEGSALLKRRVEQSFPARHLPHQ